MSAKHSAVSLPGRAKKEHLTLTIEKKMDVIRHMESGERRSYLCVRYGVNAFYCINGYG